MPVAVGGVEVARRVALAAVADPPAAVGRELLVEHGRHGLVGRGPLGVAAAEDRVGDPAAAPSAAPRDPRAERGGVVRGRPVVGGADDQHRAVAGQVVDVVVQRAESDGEAAFGALLRELGGDRLRGAEVRAEQHRQRRPVPGDQRCCRDRRRCRLRARGGRRLGPGPFDQDVRAGPDVDEEVVGLDRERGFRLELVVQVVDELEPLHQHAEHEQRLLHRELAADARPRAGAEGLVGVRRDRGHPLGRGVVGVELGRVRAPDLGVQVQRLAQHEERGVRRGSRTGRRSRCPRAVGA